MMDAGSQVPCKTFKSSTPRPSLSVPTGTRLGDAVYASAESPSSLDRVMQVAGEMEICEAERNSHDLNSRKSKPWTDPTCEHQVKMETVKMDVLDEEKKEILDAKATIEKR